MRYFITILLFFCSFSVFAQRTPKPTGLPTNHNELYNKYNGFVGVDSGLMLNKRDTNWTPINSYFALIINRTDSLPYWWNGRKWQSIAAPYTGFVRYLDSLVTFVTPTQLRDSNYLRIKDSLTKYITPKRLKDSLAYYVTLNTAQIVAASKTWNADQIFLGNVGIGDTPTTKLDVYFGNGRMFFDGTRLGLNATAGTSNIYIGLAGNISGDNRNIGIGDNALKRNAGDDNVAMGLNSLSSVSGSVGGLNVAVGNGTLQSTDSSLNVAVGFSAGVSNFGQKNISIGALSGNAKQVDSLIINTSEIVTSSPSISGSSTAAFITANSLSVGSKYPFRIIFNGGIPSPYGTTSQLFVSGAITNSNTITFSIVNFTSQGSGTFTLKLFNSQSNSIAIGTDTQTPLSNTTIIGNAGTLMTYLGGGAFDIPTSTLPAPATGHAVFWFDGTSVKVTKNVGGTTTTTTLF